MKRLLAIAVLSVCMFTLAAVPFAAAQDTLEAQNETNMTENESTVELMDDENENAENITDENVTEEDVDALELAEDTTENVSTVILTSTANYPDTLVASSAAEKTGSPILIAGDEPVEDVAPDEDVAPEEEDVNDEDAPEEDPDEDNGLLGLGDDDGTGDEATGDDALAGMGLLGAAQEDQQEDDPLLNGDDEDAPNDEEFVDDEEMPDEDVEDVATEEAVQELDNETEQLLEQMDPDEIVVIGGPQVLGANLTDDLEENHTVTRLWGYTRYGTSIEVANYFWPEGADSAMLVENERQDPDFRTLASASELAEHEQMPIYLTPEGDVPAQSLASMHHLDVQDATVVGTNITEEYEDDLEETEITIEEEITANETAELQNELWDQKLDQLDETDHAVIAASDDYHHTIAVASDPHMTTFHVTDELDDEIADAELADEDERAEEQDLNETDENGLLNDEDEENGLLNGDNETDEELVEEEAPDEAEELDDENVTERDTGELVDRMNETGIENATVIGTDELGQNVTDQLEAENITVTTLFGPAEDAVSLNQEFVQEHIVRFQDLSEMWMMERDEILEEQEDELGQRTATLIVQTERMIGEDTPQEASQALEEAATRLEDQQYERSLQVTMDARHMIKMERFDRTVDTDAFDMEVDAEIWSMEQFQQHFDEQDEEFAQAFEDEPMETRLWIILSYKYLDEDRQQQVIDQTVERWEADDDEEDLLPAFEQARQQVITAEEPVEEEDADEPVPVNETMENETLNNETDENGLLNDEDEENGLLNGDNETENNETDDDTENGANSSNLNSDTDQMIAGLGEQFVSDTRCMTGETEQEHEIRAVDSTIAAAGSVVLPTPNFNATSDVNVDTDAETLDITVSYEERDGTGMQCVGEGAFVQPVEAGDGEWAVTVDVMVDGETAWDVTETVQVSEDTDADILERDDGEQTAITNETTSGTV